ncbi:MAG: Fur family transcriptional regulator [Cytophagales bacterium]
MEIESILKEHGLRLTNARKEILSAFLERKFAISHSFLEDLLQASHDRVTIYRTLYSFEEKGIIHKVPDEGGATKYALCSQTCESHHHHDNHVHFKCEVCLQTNCIEEVIMPNIVLPTGFLAKEMGVLVLGICKSCYDCSKK